MNGSVLFDDVPAAFARWAAEGKVAIYSSGSVEAQRLFFRYSDHGDLTPLICRLLRYAHRAEIGRG